VKHRGVGQIKMRNSCLCYWKNVYMPKMDLPPHQCIFMS